MAEMVFPIDASAFVASTEPCMWRKAFLTYSKVLHFPLVEVMSLGTIAVFQIPVCRPLVPRATGCLFVCLLIISDFKED